MPNLASTELCVGCTACVSKCPKQCLSMKCDKDGFEYPEMTKQEQCINCHMCEKVCPVLKTRVLEKEKPEVFSALSMDEQIRKDSSSGGIFSEFSVAVLLDKGIVYGAAYDETWSVKHVAIDDMNQLNKLRGAKYSESNLNNTFIEIEKHLKNNRRVLFSGTPCQVAGLKEYLHYDYANLFCVDFVCHGVPSPYAWKKYLEERRKIDVSDTMPISVNLRSKETGWSNYSYSYMIEYPNGKQYVALNSDDLYMKLFCNDYISRPSCENCKFKGYSRVSDITLGDFWGIWDIDPEMDDNKGTSVVLIQSEKGKRLWEEIKGKIKYKQVTLEQASQYNPSMLVASKAKQNREDVLERIRMGRISSCEELFVQKAPSFSDRVKGKISRVIHRIMNK